MIRRCYMDGFPFSTEPILLPTKYNPSTRTFVFDNIVFCSFACAKGYLFRDMAKNSDAIQLLTLYARELFKITEPIRICPDRRTIGEYLYRDKGTGSMTIEEFRTATPDSVVTNRYHPPTEPVIEDTIEHLRVYVTDIVLPSTIQNIETHQPQTAEDM